MEDLGSSAELKPLFKMFKTQIGTWKIKFPNIIYILKAHLNYFYSCNNKMKWESTNMKYIRQS